MIIKRKGLNENEIYCCTKKEVKTAFKDCKLSVYFGLFNFSRDEKKSNEENRPYKNCSDRIVANFVVKNAKFEDTFESYLIFYILNKKGYTEDIHIKFVTEVLPKLRLLYEKHRNIEYYQNKAYEVTVGLKEDIFTFYEKIPYQLL